MAVMIPTLAVVLAAAVMAAPQESGAPGSVAGCISDTLQRFPGVTVVAVGRGVRRTTVSDSAGCYELKDLPPASYRVTALVAGFDNVTRDRMVVAPSTSTRLDFLMQVSAICECVRTTGRSLADFRDHADAVLHVRLSDSEAAPSTPRGYYRHSASVIEAVKQPTGRGPATIFVLQNQRSGTAGPYDVGQELVAFLSSDSNGFYITNDEPGLAVSTGSGDPSMVFLVRDDRIQRAPSEFSGYVGTTVRSFLEELRALPRRK
jgi:hypothetical protein